MGHKQGGHFLVKDVFEIKEDYRTQHDPGLVVVLNGRVTVEANRLIGHHAFIQLDGRTLRLVIDDAKDHLAATSLFFKTLKVSDVPVGSELLVETE